MKKVLLVSACALILSACSTSNQISITKSRYGNGIGISFGEGLSQAEQDKIDHKREVIRDRAQHRRFIQSMSMVQRTLKTISNEKEQNKPELVGASEQSIANQGSHSPARNNETEMTSSQSQEVVQTKLEISAPTKTKTAKKELKAIKKKARRGLMDIDDSLLLLIIIAVLLPPLAMLLYDGVSNRFWISLLLFFLLVWIGSLIYTLYVILSEN